MNFAHPLALLLLVLLVPVALLYWLRVRVPSRTIGTGLFWQKALAEEKARWRWQRWRTKVSVAVQMIIVVLIVLAAAGPQIPASKRMVLIVDNSATMRATDVPPTRLGEAKEVARRLIESLQSCDEMAVVMVSPAPIEVQPLTSDRKLLLAAVDAVQAMADPAAIEWAVKLAREIPMPDKVPPQIVLISDACAKEATKQAEQSGVEVLRVGTVAGNLAITCFTARRSAVDPTKCEVFVEVRNHSNQSAQGSVRLTVGEKPAQSAAFSIASDGRWQHIFTLDLPEAARLTAQVEPGDAYLFDNTAVLDVPAAATVHRQKLGAEDQFGFVDSVDLQQPWQTEVFNASPLSANAEIDPIGPISPISPIGPMTSPHEPSQPPADLRSPADIGSDASGLAVEKPWPPLWTMPAALAAVLLIIEWCLYQRRWTS